MNLILRAKQFASEIKSATARWMFAPGGVHTITPAADEGSAELTLRIDETTAPVLNACLAKLNAENSPQRAFFDKEHDQAAGATAWPLRFVWSDSPKPGVYCEHEPSALGKQLVEGKVIRAFSPSFYSDADLPKKIARGKHVAVRAGQRGSPANPARMTGLVFPACGTLTNNPAFTQILPLWAKNAGAPSGTTDNQPNQMKKLTPEQKAALQARKTELEQSLPTLRATAQAAPTDAAAAEAVTAAETELDTTDAKLNASTTLERNEELETALRAQRTKDADAAVADAVKRGAIRAADTATQEAWKNKCVEDPNNIVLLASMRGSPALESQRRIISSGLHITREDSVTVLRAYNAERDPRKKAAIFAREIAKRISDCEDLPIFAANTMGTLVGEIVAQQALELLTLEEPLLNLFSTDFSGEGAKLNQKISSRIVSIPAASDYHVDNGYVSQAQVFTDVDVTLTAHRFVQAEFNAAEIAGTSRRLFDEVAPAMADGIGADAISIALAVITAANFTNKTTEALVDFDRQTVVEFGGALRDVGVRRNRFLLLTGSYYDKLFSDQTIALLAANQKQELISGDEMMPLSGFAIHRSPTLPAAENLVGFGGGKSAILIAGRVPADYAQALPGVTGGGTSQIITNPKSGLSVHLVQFVDHQKGKSYSRMAYILGANEGQKPAGRRIVSA